MAFDFSTVGAPFRMQPGLRRLPADQPQLTSTRPNDAVMRDKLAVLTTQPDEALLCDPTIDPVGIWRRVAQRAAREHGDAFRDDGRGDFSAPALGWSLRGREVCGHGPAAIGACLRALAFEARLAGLLALAFAEDLAVLDGTTGRVPALAVCLPSRWIPRDKVGRRLPEIHAPVADGAALVAAADALVRLVVAPGGRWERGVWTLSTSPRLDAHPERVVAPAWDGSAQPHDLADAAFFRTELQRFGALADVALALFTIRVDVRPLREAVATADAAARLHAALASMSPAVLAYRGLTPARDGLLHWLDGRARP